MFCRVGAGGGSMEDNLGGHIRILPAAMVQAEVALRVDVNYPFS
jgi:hypothetical protein